MNEFLSRVSFFRTTRQWRWDLIIISILVVLFWLIFTPSSAYFLQHDTSNQDFMALAWSRGCWELFSEKTLAVLLLAPLYAIFGPSPYWETALLIICAIASAILVYELTHQISNSRFAGILAVMLFEALPATQFYSRTYFGYLIVCVLLIWFSIYNRRLGWAGLFCGLAVIAHFNSLVLIALTILASAISIGRLSSRLDWVRFSIGLLVPPAISEFLFFIHYGTTDTFIWTRSIFDLIFRFVGPVGATIGTTGGLWEGLTGVNGVVLSLALALGLVAPLCVRHNRIALAMTSVFVGFALLYVVRPSRPTVLVSSYAFWAINCGLVLHWLISRLPQPRLKAVVSTVLSLSLGGAILQTQWFIHQFTSTPYPEIESWIARAAQENRPVRFMAAYNNAKHTALYFAMLHGTEILISDPDELDIDSANHPVFIFTDATPELVLANYTQTTIVLDNAPNLYPTLTIEIGVPKQAQLWWPTEPSTSIRPPTPPARGYNRYYYAGTGCLSQPPYIDNTMWFYQLIIYKIQERLNIN